MPQCVRVGAGGGCFGKDCHFQHMKLTADLKQSKESYSYVNSNYTADSKD